jgi:hypothetical protein
MAPERSIFATIRGLGLPQHKKERAMKTAQKTALRVLATAAVAAGIGACAGPGYYDTAYVAYDECYGPYPAAYCSYPTFSGSVVIAGAYYDGLRYRDTRFGREYWLRDRWVRAEPTYRVYRRG